jgi:hypothetical protein
MAIIGLTRDKEGQPIVRQAVTHKLVIGRGPKSAGNDSVAPKKLDHIAFMKKSPDGKWVDDAELTDHYRQQSGGKPMAVRIVLFDNELETVFPHAMKAFMKRGLWCVGDGDEAQRRNLGKDNKEWGPLQPFKGPCANGGCPFVEQKKCKPTGTLYFSLVDFLKLGSLCKVQTTSYQSILQINSALHTLTHMTGGVIRGIPMKLFVQPDQSKFMQEGQLRTGNKFVWGLEVSANDMRDLTKQLTEGPREMYQMRQLSMGTVIEAEEEDEEELADEITGEFYEPSESAKPDDAQTPSGGSGPVTGSSNGKHPAASVRDTVDELDLETRADALMTQMAMGNKAQRTAEIGKHRGKMKEFVEQLEQRLGASKKTANHEPAKEETPDPAPQNSAKEKVKKASEARQQQRSEERNERNRQREAEEPEFIQQDDVEPGGKPQGGFEW